MAKDAKGHGSGKRGGASDDADFNKFWSSGLKTYEAQSKGKEPLPDKSKRGHADYFAESQAARKRAGELTKAGKHREATDARARSNELASMATHVLKSEKRGIARGKMGDEDVQPSKPVNARGDTFKPRKGR